jgi:hypothetical protein
MLTELRHVKVEQWTAFNYAFGQHFVYFSQLLSPLWDYGYSGPGLEDGMAFQLGAVTLVLVAFGGWRVLAGRFPHRGTALFFLAATALLVWLMSPAAQFLWHVLPIASLVQFPWRFLGLTAVTMSVVAGAVVARGRGGGGTRETRGSGNQESGKQGLRESGEQEIEDAGVVGLIPDCPIPNSPIPDSLIPDSPSPYLLLLLLVVVLGSFAYTLPQYTPVEDWREQPQAVVRWDRFSTADRVAMMAHTQEQPTTGPMEAQYLAGEPLQVATILDGTGTVDTLRHGGSSDEVLVKADGPVRLQFYTYDFPGWQVTIDGVLVIHRHEPPYGLITVDVPDGEHHVSLRMGGTPPRTVGSAISLIAALAIGAGLLGERIWRRPLRA